MKKFVIVSIIAAIAFSSYILFDIYRYRNVKDDFLSENPECKIISIHPASKNRKNYYFNIRYKKQGDRKIYETQWFFQESTEDARWNKLGKGLDDSQD